MSIQNRLGLFRYNSLRNKKPTKKRYNATIHRIRSFGRLKENWDSCGSGSVSKKSIRYALRVLKMFDEMRIPNILVNPTGDDSVLFEVDGMLVEVFESSTVFYNTGTKELKELSNTINMADRLMDMIWREDQINKIREDQSENHSKTLNKLRIKKLLDESSEEPDNLKKPKKLQSDYL